MSKIVFGEDFVEENCVMVNLINANSPLTFDATMLGALKVYARHNQATMVSPFIVAGAMSPVTVAAVAAQSLAEGLVEGEQRQRADAQHDIGVFPQRVALDQIGGQRIAAVDDAVAEGSHSGSISHAATSSDAVYNGISITSVTATITDNDTAGIVVGPTSGLVTTEAGGQAAHRRGGVQGAGRLQVVAAQQVGLDYVPFSSRTHLFTRHWSAREARWFLVRGKFAGRLERLTRRRSRPTAAAAA